MRNKNKHELQLFYCDTLSIEHVCTTKKNICTLVIIGQRDITSLNAISELLQLQELWIVESDITEVPCLKQNCQLQKLYLYSNKIENIPNLSNCARLKTLFLSGNNIRDLRNLRKLTWLRELNLARNKLHRITKEFSNKSELEYLNLAGNFLCFIKDIKNLAILPKLKSLIFSDPLYGECPLISFCNYRFYIINCLTHLKSLDYFSICENEIHWSNQFFKKQVMYYNVKLHTQLNVYLELLKNKHQLYQSCIFNFKQELHALKMKEKDNQTNLKNKNCNELEKLILKVKSNDREFSEWKEMLNNQLKISRKQLIFNINFVGNINFIEYNENIGNTTIQICQKILEESLCSVINTGVKGVKLFRVTKVINNVATHFNKYHNRRCDTKLNMDNVTLKILVSPCGVTDLKKWPFEFFETALFEKQEITVTDCLALADNEWLHKTFLMQPNMNVLDTLRICEKRRICVLVQAPTTIHAKTVHNINKCHTRCADQSDTSIICQRITLMNWKIVNPIFVVEYEYILHETKHKDTQNDDSKDTNIPIKTFRNHNQHQFLSQTNIIQYINKNIEQICNLVKLSISNQNIVAIDENFHLPNLRELDISYNQLLTFPNTKFIKNIRVLNVSFNKIQSLSIMEILPKLEELDISWNCLANCVSSLEVLAAFTPTIVKLNVYHNLFQDVIDNEMVEFLSQFYLPQLQYINNNARKEYSSVSNDYFPCALHMCKFNNKQHINLLNSTKEILTKNTKEIMIRRGKGKQCMKCIHTFHDSLAVPTILKEFLKIQELCATRSFLTKIPIVMPLKHLTKLNLANNFISVLDGISQQNLPKLKYLDLTNNIISNLLPMGWLPVIQEFYCGHNNICTLMQIDNVKTWNTLHVIDLSNNPISKDIAYKRFIISHLNNVKYISGEYVQNSDVIKTWTTDDILGKSVLNSMHKLEHLRNITQLTIVNCSLTKIDLSDDLLLHLESLDLSNNQITQLEGLHSLQYLHTLCLSYNCIEIFESRHEATACFFPNLYTLFLDHNKLKSLMILASKKLPVIKQLFLSYNNLNNVNEVCQYQTLESLFLDYNEIEMLSGTDFHKDNNINILSLENNRIKSLLFAKSLKKLKKFYIANNCVTNETELTFLASLKNLEEFTFTGNPLNTEVNDLDVTIQDFEVINTGF